MMSYIFGLIIMFALVFLATCVLLISHLEDKFDLKYIKSKIKDFFYPKYNEDKKSGANYADPSTDDLSELRQKVKNKDAEIEYAEELVSTQKEFADKDLYLKRLYADEDEFETLYVAYKRDDYSYHTPAFEFFQTRIEAEEFASQLRDVHNRNEGIVKELKYLPNKEEEED